MIPIEARPLASKAARKLEGWQSEIDQLGTYAERVSEGRRRFRVRNTKHNATFRDVRTTLDAMCIGARRCGYCEDSYADEVEHIRPKDLYPESVFEWANYLYVCGPCNGPKGNQYAVFPGAGSEPQVVSRDVGDPVVPPIAGDPVFLNPRGEDPLAFIILDLQGTFLFQPFAESGTRAHERGRYTIEVLRLNSREALVAARRSAYTEFRARVVEYADMVARDYPKADLQACVEALRASHHQTVWFEMKRQAKWLPQLSRLFGRVPEALDW